MPLAPPITRENAAEYARRATAARQANRARDKQVLSQFLGKTDDDTRKRIVLAQLKRLDKMLLTCSADEFPALAAAKERLWKLVFPTAGVLKPRRNDRPRMPEARGVPIPAPQSPEAVQTENPPKAQ